MVTVFHVLYLQDISSGSEILVDEMGQGATPRECARLMGFLTTSKYQSLIPKLIQFEILLLYQCLVK